MFCTKEAEFHFQVKSAILPQNANSHFFLLRCCYVQIKTVDVGWSKEKTDALEESTFPTSTFARYSYNLSWPNREGRQADFMCLLAGASEDR